MVKALGQVFQRGKETKQRDSARLYNQASSTAHATVCSSAFFSFPNSHPKTKEGSENFLKTLPQHIIGNALGYAFISQEGR